MTSPSPDPFDGSSEHVEMGQPARDKAATSAGTAASLQGLQENERQAGVVAEGEPIAESGNGFWKAAKNLLVGKALNLGDRSLFRNVSLVAFLAWVGLGADGLSSSCYGPPESFAHLGVHASYLAVFLGLSIAATVFIIATCYSHIIEVFPSGGGGYLVASKLLGNRAGVISGCALLVDYVLTITVSISAAGDAVFSLMAPSLAPWKLPCEYLAIVVLIVLNLRGVKESVQFLMPIFILFLITHTVLILGSIGLHLSSVGEVAHNVATGLRENVAEPNVGILGILGVFLFAYSMGSGTYTGLEAVSNSMPVMREPRIETAKRTMRYMAWSLAFTAGGLIVAYLLLGIQAPQSAESPTMNAQLVQDFVKLAGFPPWLGAAFVLATLLSEGTLLFVAAQAGFIDGPRVLGYMAHDSWMPYWFANLSERLATHNGILLMGGAALAALWHTAGSTSTLVLFYSINVFVTFSLSMVGMCRHWWDLRREEPLWRRRFALFSFGAVVCLGILATNVSMKFFEGGWETVVVTGLLVTIAFLIRTYYYGLEEKLKKLDAIVGKLDLRPTPNEAPPDPSQPTAVILVHNFNGLGVHTMLDSMRFAEGTFNNLVFLSVGVIDAGNFKGSDAIDDLRKQTADDLQRYVKLARSLDKPSVAYSSIGTDAVEELEKLCLQISQEFPKSVFFAGQPIFHRENWIDRLLHKQVAYSLQRRLEWAGFPMVILPCRIR